MKLAVVYDAKTQKSRIVEVDETLPTMDSAMEVPDSLTLEQRIDQNEAALIEIAAMLGG